MKIAFYKSVRPGVQGVFSRLVRWWTNGPYSHTELVLSEPQPGSQDYLCASSSFLDGGVRTKLIDLQDGHWDIVDVPVTEDQVARAKQWFIDHDGQPYDVKGIIGFIFRRADSNTKWFCSEAVAEALGIRGSWRLDPNTFSDVVRSMSGIK